MGDTLALFSSTFFFVSWGCVLLILCVCVCLRADDWEEAFQTLKQVVREYLLLEEQEGGSDSNRASPDNISTGVFVHTNSTNSAHFKRQDTQILKAQDVKCSWDHLPVFLLVI